MSEYVKCLGKGTYGSVHLFGDKQDDGSTIYNAVKVCGIERYKSLEKEFRILTKLKGCRSIVQVLGNNNNTLVEETDSDGNRIFCMDMEYAAGGTLHDYIQTNKTKLSDSIIKDITCMILQGLVSVHSLGYVHCDLKPDNILLFPRDKEEIYELKISDFGVSTKAGEESECWDVGAPFVGTHLYMSPESVQESQVQPTLDLWSLGCIVLEMYTGKCPWFGLGINEVESNLMYDQAPNIPESVPCDARRFMEKCFARKPEERGTASELLLHPFLNGDQKMAQETKKRVRKCKPKSNDISKKPIKTIVSTQFKRTSKKPRTVKILPPRSDFVSVE